MRAVRVETLSGPEGLAVVEVPVPDAQGDVLLDVHAAGVCFPDLLLSRGLYQRKPELPFVPGVEVAGVVRDPGPSATLERGDRVAAFVQIGGWAQTVRARPGLVFPLPAAMSFRTGAGVALNYLTAHLSLIRRGALRAGETLVVHGAAGGLGTAVVQVGKALGARVIAVVSTPVKAELALDCGADEAVLLSGWLDTVGDLVGPAGVDVVADPVGGDRFLDSIRCLSREGRLLVLGFADGTIPTVTANRLLLKNIDVRGVAWGNLIEAEPGFAAKQWQDVRRWIEDGHIRPVDGAMFDMEDAASALRALDSRSATGKITLCMKVEDRGPA